MQASGAQPGLEIEAAATVKNRIFLGEQTEYLVDAEDFGEVLVRTVH